METWRSRGCRHLHGTLRKNSFSCAHVCGFASPCAGLPQTAGRLCRTLARPNPNPFGKYRFLRYYFHRRRQLSFPLRLWLLYGRWPCSGICSSIASRFRLAIFRQYLALERARHWRQAFASHRAGASPKNSLRPAYGKGASRCNPCPGDFQLARDFGFIARLYGHKPGGI